MDKKKENISKEAIVAKYLTSSISYRGLEMKYGIEKCIFTIIYTQ